MESLQQAAKVGAQTATHVEQTFRGSPLERFLFFRTHRRFPLQRRSTLPSLFPAPRLLEAMPTLAHFFGLPSAEAQKGEGQKKKSTQEDLPTPTKDNKKRSAGDGAASGTKKRRRPEATEEGASADPQESSAGKWAYDKAYDKEKEDDIRRRVEQMEEASEQERIDIDAVGFGMIEHMEKQPKPCKPESIKSYALAMKFILKRDGRSYSAMGMKDYYELVKSMFENKKAHGLQSAAVKKYQEFYADTVEVNGGTFKLAQRWLDKAEEAKRVDAATGLRLRSSADAEHQGSRVVGIFKDDKGRWVASYQQKRLGAFGSEEMAVQAILRAKRELSVKAIGMKPLTWAKPKPTAESQAQKDVAGAVSEQSAMPPGVDSSEITEMIATVSIVDPVSLTRIETPVRGPGCRHVGVFDKATYIEFNEMKSKMIGRLSKLWNCPICGAIAKPEALIVIPAFVQVLATLQDMPDIDQIDVMPDGRLQVPGGAVAAKPASAPCPQGEDVDHSDGEAAGSSPAAGKNQGDSREAGPVLTEEQKKLIAAKRQEALERKRQKELAKKQESETPLAGGGP